MDPLPTLAQQAVTAAQSALEKTDLTRARREAERARAYAPEHPVVRVLLAEVARTEGHLEEAATLYEQALGAPLDEENAWYAHANLAEVLLDRGAPREALDHAQVAIEIYPDQVDPYVAAARAYLLLQQANNALSVLNEAVELEADYAMPWVLRGDLYAANRSYGDALNDYAQAIELEPQNPRHYIAVAQVAMQTRDAQLALNTLNEGLAAVNPEQHLLLRELRARLLLQLGERDVGLRELDAIIARMDEPPIPTLFARAEARFDTGDVDGALADYDTILARDATHPGALEGRLDALIALERRAEARALLEQLAEQAPSADLHTRRGDFFWEEGEPEVARAAYEQALAMEARHPLASYNLALLLMEEKNFQRALPYLDLAVELAPEDEERLCDRSVALRHTGRPYLAWLDADRALENNEGYLVGYLARAGAAIALGEHDDALEDLRTALTLEPDYGAALAPLARLYEQQGQRQAAREVWTRYLDLPAEEQDEEIVQEARAAVKL
ncbi:MAG: tetratricopeptide repeat protein [Chloroflexota bacterium]|nr:tetratricopeptide repeat protein [Chloroflexota bacterium]